MLALARYTGWSRAELLAMPARELVDWLTALPEEPPRPVYLVELQR